MFELILAFIDLFILSAPWLILGFVIAGGIKAFLQKDFLLVHMGGHGLLTTIKAALIGAPLPLCSCGVVPAALGLRQSGASKNATVAFLIATPETGVDSVLFTNALMGPLMAIIRPIAAVFSAVLAGVLVGKDDEIQESKIYPSSCCESEAVKESESCCSKTEAKLDDKKGGCDSGENTKSSDQTLGLTRKLKEGLIFSFDKMLRDIVNWLVLGLIIAAVMQTFLSPEFFAQYGQGFSAMVVMALIGVPMYVCATASTPIAAGFLLSGLSPGAVLVFMLVGPATNIGTLMIIKNELGLRSIVAYLGGLVFSAFLFGFLLNYGIDVLGLSVQPNIALSEHQHVSLFDQLMAFVLAVLVIRALWINLREKMNAV